MSYQDHLRQALEDGDADLLWKLWRHVYPQLPQVETRDEAVIAMHIGRTATETVTMPKRLYSHAWLCERGFPSQLPDDLKPPPEQVRPRIVPAVGIAVNSLSDDPERQQRAKAIEAAMAQAAGDCYASGIFDKDRVVRAMWAARAKFLQRRVIHDMAR